MREQRRPVGRPRSDIKKQQEKYEAGGVGTKRCAKCGEVKDKGEFYRYAFAGRNRGDAEGFRSRCKACVREDAAEYKRQNSKQVNAYMRAVRARVKAEKKAAAKEMAAEQRRASATSVRNYLNQQQS